MSNQKYEITDMTHEKYPFLHRIRAQRDIGKDVKAGDLGGFVEHEGNLSFELGDDAWVYNDAIVAGDGYVDKDTALYDRAIVCGHARVSQYATLADDARVEDDARIQSAAMFGSSRLSGCGMLLPSPDDPQRVPVLFGHSCVYGKVTGDVRIKGDTVVISGEEICNDSPEVIWIDGLSRTVFRNIAQGELYSRRQDTAEKRQKSKTKEHMR